MATEHQTATHSSASPALTESRRVAAEVEQLIGPAAAGDQRAVSDILRAVHPLVGGGSGAPPGDTPPQHRTAPPGGEGGVGGPR
ncbi:hypothetical protein [Nocardia farcinica]|uniref:hypothetical protein n=1 Tax=Nocardia farcinica TaxID=37329 RepID=UPI002455E355|nr:hypothetical protein [Nocardia farcinica]